MAKEFIKCLKDTSKNLSCELKPKRYKKSKYIEVLMVVGKHLPFSRA